MELLIIKGLSMKIFQFVAMLAGGWSHDGVFGDLAMPHKNLKVQRTRTQPQMPLPSVYTLRQNVFLGTQRCRGGLKMEWKEKSTAIERSRVPQIAVGGGPRSLNSSASLSAENTTSVSLLFLP